MKVSNIGIIGLTCGVLAIAPAPAAANAPAKPGVAAKTSEAAVRSVRPAGRTYPFDEASGPAVYLVGGEVHVGDGTVVRDGVVEMVGSRIRSVGARSSIPAGANVIDVSGKVVTPGFIAAACALGLVEINAEESTRDDTIAGDAVSPIRAAYDASVAVNAESSLLQINAIEGITSAASTPSDGLISGQVAWIDLVYGDHRDIVSTSGVAMAANAGHAYAGSRPATLAKLRETLADAQFYRRNRSAFDRRQARDLAAHPLDLAALDPVLQGEMPLVVAANRVSDIRALIAMAREFDFQLVISDATQAWKVASELAAAKVPVLLQPSHNLPASFEHLGARLDAAALLHQAGVTIGIAPLFDAHNARNIAQEAGIAVANGLDYEAALTAVTLNVARIYGMDEDYGSLAAGKVANVVVWDGDPFELSAWPTAVYIRGRAIPMVSRQTLLRDRYLPVASD